MDQLLISLAQKPEYRVALVSVLITGTVALVPLLIDGRKAKRGAELRRQELVAAMPHGLAAKYSDRLNTILAVTDDVTHRSG